MLNNLRKFWARRRARNYEISAVAIIGALEDYDAAADYLDKALALNALSSQSWGLKALVEIHRGNLDTAKMAAIKCLDLEPQSKFQILCKAIECEANSEITRAINMYRELVETERNRIPLIASVAYHRFNAIKEHIEK